MIDTPVAQLSPDEQNRLINAEIVIRDFLWHFYRVGKAMRDINDAKLFRIEYDTFESYCEQKWQISYRHAKRLMDCVFVFDTIQNMTHGSCLPTNERQIRPLIGFSPTEINFIWKKISTLVNNDPQKITGELVEKVVAGLLKPKEPEVDLTGRPVKVRINPDYQKNLRIFARSHNLTNDGALNIILADYFNAQREPQMPQPVFVDLPQDINYAIAIEAQVQGISETELVSRVMDGFFSGKVDVIRRRKRRKRKKHATETTEQSETEQAS